MTLTMPLTEARSKLPGLMNGIKRRADRVVITRNGKPEVVMVNAEEYESWMETLALLADPKARAGIRQGMRELKAGRTRSFEEVFGRKQGARR